MPVFLDSACNVKYFASITNRQTIDARREYRIPFPCGVRDELLWVHWNLILVTFLFLRQFSAALSHTQTNMPLHGVFKAAINGIHTRGDGGFVYVKGDSCAYVFPNELNGQEELKKSLTSLLSHPDAQRMFYVAEERDGNLNLRAYERTQVLADFQSERVNTADRIEEM